MRSSHARISPDRGNGVFDPDRGESDIATRKEGALISEHAYSTCTDIRSGVGQRTGHSTCRTEFVSPPMSEQLTLIVGGQWSYPHSNPSRERPTNGWRWPPFSVRNRSRF